MDMRSACLGRAHPLTHRERMTIKGHAEWRARPREAVNGHARCRRHGQGHAGPHLYAAATAQRLSEHARAQATKREILLEPSVLLGCDLATQAPQTFAQDAHCSSPSVVMLASSHSLRAGSCLAALTKLDW